jgi:hypothetical protein
MRPGTIEYKIRFSDKIAMLSPWSRVLYEGGVVPQLVKIFIAYYRTQKFITWSVK